MHKPYDGKAQFTDSLDAIEDMVNEGHTGTDIYRTLTEAEKITLSYKQFQRYLADYNTPKESLAERFSKTKTV